MKIWGLWDQAEVCFMELGGGVCGHGDRVREEEPMELRLGHNGYLKILNCCGI